jgi:hypothetical protein
MSSDWVNGKWDDYQLLGLARAGGTAPAFAARADGVYMWRFDTTNDELHAPAQLPHRWNKLLIKPHVHWEPRATETVTGTWEMTYIWVNPANGSVVNTGLATATGAFNLAGTLGQARLTDLTDITLTSPTISALLVARLKLSAFTAGTGVWLWGWDFHWQAVRGGTINPASEP